MEENEVVLEQAQEVQQGDNVEMPLENTVTEPAPKEPGYVKTRIEKAVQKSNAELEARLRAEYDSKISALLDAKYESEAEKLVASGEFKSKDTALEYVKLKGGVQPEKKTTAPIQSEAKTVEARAQELYSQAVSVQEETGVDVLQIYNDSPAIQKKVAAGKLDFNDIAELYGGNKTPPVVRSANINAGGVVDFGKISNKQFASINEQLKQGKVIDLRR